MPSVQEPKMPTRNINLTDHFDQFVQQQVDSGQYRNVSEFMRAGLRLLEQKAQQEGARLQALRSLAAVGFKGLDQGRGIELSGKQDLAEFIAGIGRRAATTAKRRARSA
jgi:antitoxin ParD1/3/4